MSMVVAPIFAVDETDVIAFPSIKAAENFLEPYDVEAHTYRIFDSTGLVLDALVEPTSGLFWTPRTRLYVVNPCRREPDELAAAAFRFLQAVAKSRPEPGLDQIEELPFDELIRLLAHHAGMG